MLRSENTRAVLLGLLLLVVSLGLWEWGANDAGGGSIGELTEYERLTGGAAQPPRRAAN